MYPSIEEVIKAIDSGIHPTSIGWSPLIRDLCVKILALGEKDVQVTDIKSKFGGLSFYIYGGSEAVDALIEAAESASTEICEVCGKPGKLYLIGLYVTMCEEHYAEYREGK